MISAYPEAPAGGAVIGAPGSPFSRNRSARCAGASEKKAQGGQPKGCEAASLGALFGEKTAAAAGAPVIDKPLIGNELFDFLRTALSRLWPQQPRGSEAIIVHLSHPGASDLRRSP